MEVEGTHEEILRMKDELDRREEVKHNYKIVYHTHTYSPTAVSDELIDLMRKYPSQVFI